ncbi:MAG: hypothetical protein VB018_13340 [Lachnospiraceae bacterium]|nr:hypothetical protein [Lachnospiraceae bacterium]
MAIVYIQMDSNNCVTSINSDIFLTDTTDWIQIDEGIGDKYSHAQGNYFDTPLTNDDGVYLYKYVDGIVAERTAEEIAADIPEKVAVPTDAEKIETLQGENTLLKAQVNALSENQEFLEDCLIEMAQEVYA